jgi:hypothetical protein
MTLRAIRDFFSLPIPRAVWDRVKVYESPELRRFIDEKLIGDLSTGE